MPLSYKQESTKGFDGRLILYYSLLVIIGWLTIFSTSYNPSASQGFSFSLPYVRQLLWIGTSIVLAVVILLLDSRIIQHYSYHFYILCLLLVISTFFLGSEINGAKVWIKIGAFSIQPSEFMKLATALALAKFFNEGKTLGEKRSIWFIAFGIILTPAFIILLQKDTGSALVFFSFIVLFYREGMSGIIFIIGAIAVFLFVFTLLTNEIYAIALLTVILIIAWIIDRKDKKKIIRNIIIYAIAIVFIGAVNIGYNKILQPHQRQRIDTILGKTSDPKGADFNLIQSKIAIGSGGFFGKGYLNGTQTKLNFVPEQSTDFIFCAIGEEWGFVGSCALGALFLSLVIRILRLAEKNRNPYARYYGYGIAGIIAFHFFINIGMTVGLVPIIGIPLPFISYGGSSLWAFTAMLFIFIKLNDN
ncbi:MAG: rod shape-determining protein RodA [Bacteroidales bacterium]|jgi:rod shape determining protein RodA|nr:rod shape-determining protein RodA [Bacteroidales bacterium]MBR6063328.1 rod shape-determining protein RodA [Bacteroidales bacterium]